MSYVSFLRIELHAVCKNTWMWWQQVSRLFMKSTQFLSDWNQSE